MGKVTVYCIVSGCTPEIAENLLFRLRSESECYGPVVTSALRALADQHELHSQDDLCVIGPIDPSGQPYGEAHTESHEPRTCDPLPPETNIRVVPHCVMGDSWDLGFVDAPPPNEERCYLVSYGWALMIQTHALDIMALATRGRMTPLRLWRLAMVQGFVEAGRRCYLEGVDYGEITGNWEQVPEEFPGFTASQLVELEEIGDVEVVKQRMVHRGLFWVWMAPNHFPVAPTAHERPVQLPEAHPTANRSAIENLPSEVLIPIVSFLSLTSVLNLASASRSLRTGILGNDYLACVWIYNNAPWWIPVPTQTSMTDDQDGLPITAPQAYPASEWQWSAHIQLSVEFPAGLDWAYIRRCAQSGSMRNRERIWHTALDIENVANLTGV